MGLVDQENTYNFAIDKLIKWKYEVFVIDRQAEFNKEYIWIAKKSGKSFSADIISGIWGRILCR